MVDRWTDGWTDKLTDGQTDKQAGQMDRIHTSHGVEDSLQHILIIIIKQGWFPGQLHLPLLSSLLPLLKVLLQLLVS